MKRFFLCLSLAVFGVPQGMAPLHANARHCGEIFRYHVYYRELREISDSNRRSYKKLQNERDPARRRILAADHLEQAIRFEENKANIYVKMMADLLIRKGNYEVSLRRLADLLQRSVSDYQNLSLAKENLDASFQSVPMKLKMDTDVASYLSR